MKTHFHSLVICFLSLTLALLCTDLTAQETTTIIPTSKDDPQFVSDRHAQSAFYKQFRFQSESQFDSLHRVMYKDLPTRAPTHQRSSDNLCSLRKQVYGYQPYWIGSSVYNTYQYELLSTFIYFSYELNPANGSYDDIHFWKTSNAINLAKQAGSRVELCVTNFGSTANAQFLNNETAWDRLIDSLLVLLPLRNADGVNIDFEGIASAQAGQFTEFMQHLGTRMHSEMPGSSVSVALYAVDWNNIFDMQALDDYVDTFILMGYDYHYGGDPQAGPVAPLYTGDLWSQYSLFKSINDYLAEGTNAQKMVMALPYYGYDWATEDATVPTATVANASSRTYSYIQQNFENTYTRQWDEHSLSPYFIYTDNSNGQTRQCWYDDAESLGRKYDFALNKNLGGVGIWALGYDAGYGDLWELLRQKMTDCGTTCGNKVYDTGGQNGQYRNGENYTFTLSSPDGESPITLSFNTFALGSGDELRIYDGNNSNSPLLGTFSGSTVPGIFNSSGASLTLHFISDGSVRGEGFEAQWSCACSANTLVEPLQGVYTNDFEVSFQDNDNCSTPNITERYYQVITSTNEAMAWQGNAQIGFLDDEFDAGTLSEAWGAPSGTWIYDDGAVQQINATAENSNLYAVLRQNDEQAYLYHWRFKMTGAEGNRRAGIHFFADDSHAENRGNSYFVYLRADADKVQIYKSIDNVYDLKTNDTYSVAADAWIECKVTYNPQTGWIKVYVDNHLASAWQDGTPLEQGEFVSLRTGGCEATYAFVKTYKARSDDALTVRVGADADNNDVVFDGTNGKYCRIASIVRNTAHWSNIAFAQTQIGETILSNVFAPIAPSAWQTYPIPATNYLYVRQTLPISVFTSDACWQLSDLNGRVVREQKTMGAAEICILVADLPVGVYILRGFGNGLSVTKRVVVGKP